MKTALVGRYYRGQMISAKPSKIIRERCRNGLKEIKVAIPKDDAPLFRYSRPDRLRIGDQPKVMDPFTKRNVFIGDGVMNDGVFAKRDISKGEVILYFSGLFWNETDQALFTRDIYHNQSLDECWNIQRNLISFQGPIKIHIPEPYWNISNYRSTLGHKVNHSFKTPPMANFGYAFHPRFGNIRCVYAEANITKNEEIFVHYGYPRRANVPDWYADLYFKETGKHLFGKKKKVIK